MIDGNYNIAVSLPGGNKPGSVELRTEGNVVYANIDAPVVGRQTLEGKVDGNTFTAEGSFRMFLLGKVKYVLNGEVSGDDLTISIESNKGELSLTGVRA